MESSSFKDDVKLPVYTALPSGDVESAVDLAALDARRKRKRRRAFKFSFLTLVAIVSGLALFGDAPEPVKRYCSMSKKPQTVPEVQDVAGHGMADVDMDSVVTIDCPSWDSVSKDTFYFDLPIEEKTALFFVNKEQKHEGRPPHPGPHHGFLPSGNIQFIVDDSKSVKSDVAKVEVKATKSVDDIVAAHVRVCSIEAESDEKEHPGKAVGVGIFTDQHMHHEGPVSFDITVTFPSSASLRETHYIPGLVTRLPLFSHDFKGLDGKVDIGLLAIGAVNSEIKADSISAKAVFIRNANGDIEGNFNSESGFLEISTANGFIKANVTVKDSEEEENHSRLVLRTANGEIDANVTLSSYSSDSAPGVFDVTASTAHANVNLNFISAPVDSTLNLKASTASASAYVKLHETYEGSFRLSTALGKAEVVENNGVEDPKGKKRTRRVSYDRKTKWATSGSVFWESGNDLLEENGHAYVHTALGDAILVL